MKLRIKKMKDSYFELVRQFPLIPIKSDRQYDDAIAFLEPLVVKGESSLDSGEAAYVQALSVFVEDYEQEHHRIKTRNLAPIDVLKFLMTENQMKAIDLGKILGSRSVASQVLNGKRALSKKHIIALSQRFKVDPGLFIEAA